MKLVVIFALLAGTAAALRASLNAESGRLLGLPGLVALSGFTTGTLGLLASLFFARPEISAGSVGLGLASGTCGVVILGSVAFAVSHGGAARALSLVVAAQLTAGLVFDAIGLFGAGAQLSLPKVLGVALVTSSAACSSSGFKEETATMLAEGSAGKKGDRWATSR